MEPMTMIAVANFAMGLLQKKGPDPTDAIVEMIKNLNEKLNNISGKLQDIDKRLLQIPDLTVYKQYVDNINSVVEQTKVIYQDYQSDLREFKDERKGKQKFLKANAQIVQRKLEILQDNFYKLKRFNDPLTINLICLCATIDYELSMLIEKDIDYIHNQQKDYLKHLRESIFTSKNSSKYQLQLAKKSLDELIEFRLYENRYVKSSKEERKHRGGKNDGFYREWTEPKKSYHHYLHNPKYIIKKSNNAEQEIINNLYLLGYFEEKKILIFEMLESKNLTKPEEIKIVKTYKNNCSTKLVRKKHYGNKSYSNKWERKCNELNNRDFKSDINNAYNEYILVALANHNGLQTISRILTLIN